MGTVMKRTTLLLVPPGAVAALLVGALILGTSAGVGRWLAPRHTIVCQAAQTAGRPVPVGTSDDEGPPPCNVANPCGKWVS